MNVFGVNVERRNEAVWYLLSHECASVHENRLTNFSSESTSSESTSMSNSLAKRALSI